MPQPTRLFASFLALACASAAQAAPPARSLAEQADWAAASDTLALDFAEGLTTEVGPRLGGTEAEARARAYAQAWLRAHGFAAVGVEPFRMPVWVRGEEEARLTAPFAQPLAITALGASAATPPGGITAEVVYFADYAALEAAPAGSLAGKIAFISHDMRPTQDGSGYGFAGPVRWTGPGLAASKGAIAAVIRSVGTESHRTPHTGGTGFASLETAIPAAAMSNPDADNLERIFARRDARPVMMHLTLTPRWTGEHESGNVVAEITGRDPKLAPVLLACHLDSWDLGTGAVDDAAGCAIIAAAAKAVGASGRPLRTIRLLFAGAEEVGVHGGKAYAAAHKGEAIFAGIESDFGADRVWRLDASFADSDPALFKAMADAVARFGVARGSSGGEGGADIGLARESGGAILTLKQDGTRYFDLHHTADDTFDKIDPAQLRQNVAVWTQVVGLLANRAEAIVPPPPASAR